MEWGLCRAVHFSLGMSWHVVCGAAGGALAVDKCAILVMVGGWNSVGWVWILLLTGDQVVL